MKKRILNLLSLILIFLLIGFQSHAQNLKGVKTITKFENDSIILFQLFDTSSNLIFSKQYKDYNGFWVDARYYNSKKQLIKIISGYNSGYMIWEYEYDSLANEVRSYLYDDIIDQAKTRVYYPYIRSYSTVKDFESDSIIIKMSEKRRRRLFTIESYDMRRQKLTETKFHNDSISEVSFYKYDYNNNLVEINYQIYKGKFLVLYDYKNKTSQSFKIDEKGDTVEMDKYKYDIENHKIEDSAFRKGKFKYCYKYFYKNDNLIKKLFFTSNSKLSTEDHYFYNAKGNIKRQKTIDHWDNSTTVYKWKYEFY